MKKIYFDGLANPYLKPKDKEEINRKGIYTLIYIKDIDSFMLTAPMAHINEDHYKMAGGGLEGTENNLEALKRELIEEVGFPLTDKFRFLASINYQFNFKPLKITDEYWLQSNSYFLYEVDSISEAGYPSLRWVSELENILIKIIKREELTQNPEKMHFVQRMAFKHFIQEINNEKILYMENDSRIS